MLYIWLSFFSGSSYCLEFTTTANIPMHSLLYYIELGSSTREFTALGCPLKSFRNMVLNAVRWGKTIANKVQRATKRGKFVLHGNLMLCNLQLKITSFEVKKNCVSKATFKISGRT